MLLTYSPLSESELEWTRQLHNDPSTLEMLTDTHVVSEEEQKKWFYNLLFNPKSERVVVFVDGEPAGLIRLDNIDNENKSICVGLDIDPKFRGLGLSYRVYDFILDHYFGFNSNLSQFNRIWLLVADFNERAKHIYEKIGFKEEGRQREALFRYGKYHDYVMMSILRSEYKGLDYA